MGKRLAHCCGTQPTAEDCIKPMYSRRCTTGSIACLFILKIVLWYPFASALSRKPFCLFFDCWRNMQYPNTSKVSLENQQIARNDGTNWMMLFLNLYILITANTLWLEQYILAGVYPTAWLLHQARASQKSNLSETRNGENNTRKSKQKQNQNLENTLAATHSPTWNLWDYEILKMIWWWYPNYTKNNQISLGWAQNSVSFILQVAGGKGKLGKKNTGLQKTWSPTQTLEEVYFRQETKPALHKSSSGFQLKSRVKR